MIKNIIFIYYNQNAEQIYNTLILNADDDLSKKMWNTFKLKRNSWGF
jgi:hypothetical protein